MIIGGRPITIVSQLGDGYPGDLRLENRLFKRIGGTAIRYSEFLNTYNDGNKIEDFEYRMTCLRSFISGLDADEIVIFGRSAGLRAATRLAHEGCPKLRAIMGFCYPFRHPKRASEPDRVAHLADLTTPTLIIQGDGDRYGGADVATLYSLSKAIELHVIPADHGFSVSPAQWDWIAGAVTSFLERHCRESPAPMQTPCPPAVRASGLVGGDPIGRGPIGRGPLCGWAQRLHLLLKLLCG